MHCVVRALRAVSVSASLSPFDGFTVSVQAGGGRRTCVPVADHLPSEALRELRLRRDGSPAGGATAASPQRDGHGRTWRGVSVLAVADGAARVAFCPLAGAGRVALAVEECLLR
eukprot:13588511-Alexandrium_andersonii.AAC.1